MNDFARYWLIGLAITTVFWLLVHVTEKRDPQFPQMDWFQNFLDHRRIPLVWVGAIAAMAAMSCVALLFSPEAGCVAIWLLARCVRPTSWWVNGLPGPAERRRERLENSRLEYERAWDKELNG